MDELKKNLDMMDPNDYCRAQYSLLVRCHDYDYYTRTLRYILKYQMPGILSKYDKYSLYNVMSSTSDVVFNDEEKKTEILIHGKEYYGDGFTRLLVINGDDELLKYAALFEHFDIFTFRHFKGIIHLGKPEKIDFYAKFYYGSNIVNYEDENDYDEYCEKLKKDESDTEPTIEEQKALVTKVGKAILDQNYYDYSNSPHRYFDIQYSVLWYDRYLNPPVSIMCYIPNVLANMGYRLDGYIWGKKFEFNDDHKTTDVIIEDLSYSYFDKPFVLNDNDELKKCMEFKFENDERFKDTYCIRLCDLIDGFKYRHFKGNTAVNEEFNNFGERRHKDCHDLSPFGCHCCNYWGLKSLELDRYFPPDSNDTY